MAEDMAQRLKEAQMSFSNSLTAKATANGLLVEMQEDLETLQARIVDQTKRVEMAQRRATEAKEFYRRLESENTIEARLAAARKQQADAMAAIQQEASEAQAAEVQAKNRQLAATEKMTALLTAKGEK